MATQGGLRDIDQPSDCALAVSPGFRRGHLLRASLASICTLTPSRDLGVLSGARTFMGNGADR
jgi:hypothetical protein